MQRTADAWLFRARAVAIAWDAVAKSHLTAAARAGLRAGRPVGLPEGRDTDVRLTWVCHGRLGVPHGPFQVWVRRPADELRDVDFQVSSSGAERRVTWGGVEAGVVTVTCTADVPGGVVGVFLLRFGDNLDHVIAAEAVTTSGGSPVTLTVRCQGATSARVVGGSVKAVQIDPLERIVTDPAWEPWEDVGLPVDQPWPGVDYDWRDQGLAAAPTSPIEAALERLQRAGPPIGWYPVTEGGRLSPPWAAPDLPLLVEETRKTVLPEITDLYAAGAREYLQSAITVARPVAPPTQGGAVSTATASADTGPWPMLSLPALSDPFLNLALGFGTGYPRRPGQRGSLPFEGNVDFLVTARYAFLPPPGSPGGEMAAFAPRPSRHEMVPGLTGYVVAQDGLAPPLAIDREWRESISVSWNRIRPTAAQPEITEAAFAAYDLGGGDAVSLLPRRDSGGDRPLMIVPDGTDGEPGFDRIALVDGGAPIPIGSGGRHLGYAAAQSDICGIWSPWRDGAWHGTEPPPVPPRVISARLDTRWAGSSACPSTLVAELSLEWRERTTTALDVVAIYFPMASSLSPPPPGARPDLVAPVGCFRRDLRLTFAGDVPTAAGCTVICLSADGTAEVATGAAQGEGTRRYRLTADVPVLDFGGTTRWGVALWASRRLLVGASPSSFAPDLLAPATAATASPVPVAPLPPPPVPGVPLGSTVDDQGRSHVRVHWSLPNGADVRTCVVWECSETALRQRHGLTPQAADTQAPGQRLVAALAAYEAMSDTDRRASFRRLADLPGAARDHDVALPKGSTDIHFFLVTATTSTCVEGPWPNGPGAPSSYLQYATAPRLRSPAPPAARVSVAMDGTVSAAVFVASEVPVQTIRLFATPSPEAARDVSTMGPARAEFAVATPSATDTDPSTGQATPAVTDPVTGALLPGLLDPVTRVPVWRATWTGTVPERWDPWLIRTVAVPVDTVPQRAQRGLPSPASDIVSIVVPPTTAPWLDPLTPDIWGGDHRGVVVRTGTRAPDWPLSLGAHRFTVEAGGQGLNAVAIETLPLTTLTTPPPAAATDVVLERGPRAAGHSPLALWFTRPVAADPVTVSLTLTDPFGRSTTQTCVVPGWVPPPAVHLAITSLSVIAGRGVVAGIDTDASAAVRPPFTMEITAVQALSPRHFGFGRGSGRPVAPRRLTGGFPFDTIPSYSGAFPHTTQIVVARMRRRGPLGLPRPNYVAFIPLLAPLSVRVSVVAPDGATVTVSGST